MKWRRNQTSPGNAAYDATHWILTFIDELFTCLFYSSAILEQKAYFENLKLENFFRIPLT